MPRTATSIDLEDLARFERIEREHADLLAALENLMEHLTVPGIRPGGPNPYELANRAIAAAHQGEGT